MPRGSFDPEGLLEALLTGGVRFVLVGGVAAVTQGAPLSTFDLDIVHDRAPENVAALIRVLVAVDAHYRNRPRDQRIEPAESALRGPGHHNLMTRHGPLDVLGTIEGGRDHASLLASSVEVDFGGHALTVLGLETLVAIKESSNDEKDRAALPVLRATLEAVRRGRPG